MFFHSVMGCGSRKRLFRILAVSCLLQQFQLSSTLTYSVTEEQERDSFVGNIAEDSDLLSEVGDDEYFRLRYKFLAGGNSFSKYFKLDSTSGILTTAVVFDREAICPYMKHCELDLDIAARSSISVFLKIISFKVFVLDLNDNPPKFPTNERNFSIQERAPIGSEFPIDGARDMDSGIHNGVQSYTLTPTTFPFHLKVEQTVGDNFNLRLSLSRSLDREDTDRYVGYVIATDGGSPPQTGTLTVNVVVEDINDNVPTFESSFYNLTVDEKERPNSIIVRLHATDADEKANGAVRYRISPYHPGYIYSTFGIHNESGDLYIKKVLEYETRVSYRFIVEAYDNGSPSLSAQVEVLVNVLDSTNDPPKIDLNLLTNGTVSEYADTGFPVAHIRVTDEDGGKNGETHCEVRSSSFALTKMNEHDYSVVTSHKMDREHQAFYNVTVICKDKGETPQITQSLFPISIHDENDNQPAFVQDNFRLAVPENVQSGYSVFTVTATDLDAGQNGKFSYYIENDSSFQIDHNSGVLSTNRKFDRESRSQYYLTILAIDMGRPPLTGTTNVIITITDVNDMPPRFTMSHFVFTVEENLPENRDVGIISAIDLDEGQNGAMSFVIIDTLDHSFPFRLFANGVIKTKRVLDRETRDEYKFRVVAKDNGIPPLSSTVPVTIHVSDTNDYIPKFTHPNESDFSTTISADTKPGSILTTFKAYDPDEGMSGELVFNIDDGENHHLFYLTDNGDLVLGKSLHVSRNVSYKLLISVHDRGYPQRSSRGYYIIDVLVPKRPVSQFNTVVKEESEDNKHILIAIIISCVTVAMAFAIVVTIYVLRRRDRDRRNYRTKSAEFRVIDNERRDSSEFMEGGEAIPANHFEKDVDMTERGDFQRGTRTLTPVPAFAPFHGMGPGHHPSPNRCPLRQVIGGELSKSAEETPSDSSGDTNTCDSGRGGSEEDVSNHNESSNSEGFVEYNPYTAPLTVEDSTYASFSTFLGCNQPPEKSILQNNLNKCSKPEHNIKPDIKVPHGVLAPREKMLRKAGARVSFSSTPSYMKSPNGITRIQHSYSSPEIADPSRLSRPVPRSSVVPTCGPQIKRIKLDTNQNYRPASANNANTNNFVMYNSLEEAAEEADGDSDSTTTSGSYTISPQELNREIQNLLSSGDTCTRV